MPTKCAFLFEARRRTFFAGEQINGKVCLTTDKTLLVQAISLTFRGLQHVEWLENHKLPPVLHDDCAQNDMAHTVYSGSEQHIADCLMQQQNVILAAATYTFDFSFKVPANTPTSCQQKYGYISYELQLLLQLKSGAKHNKIFREHIVVRQQLDLNELPNLKQPINYFDNDSEINFQLSHTGFVPGQLIHCQLHCTADKCLTVCLKLCQRITCHSQLPMPKSKEIIKIISQQQITGLLALTQHDVTLPIPLTAAPITTTANGTANNLLQIDYYLEAVLFTHKRHIVNKFMWPIIIGTVAIRNAAQNRQGIIRAENAQYFCYDNVAICKEMEETPPSNTSTDASIICKKEDAHDAFAMETREQRQLIFKRQNSYFQNLLQQFFK